MQQCLHCTDAKVGNVVPGPLGDMVHGSEAGDVLHFGYLNLGRSDEIEVGGLVKWGYGHQLVLVDVSSR